jgi:hypothetical protein
MLASASTTNHRTGDSARPPPLRVMVALVGEALADRPARHVSGPDDHRGKKGGRRCTESVVLTNPTDALLFDVSNSA